MVIFSKQIGCDELEIRSKRLIHIHNCRGVTRNIIKRFFQQDPTLKSIYSLSASSLSKAFLFPMKNATLFYSDLHNLELSETIRDNLRDCDIVTILDKNYPNILRQIKDPPLVLYVKGDPSILHHQPGLSVIGTRKPSNEAGSKIKHIVIPLIKKDWMLISGMAKGIDSYAHHLSLRYGGKTIAVLGGGFNHIYPKENMKLFHQIVENGLVISEYPPHLPPTRYHFPERNRIISGLSFGTLVIEAMERSGTMITVDQALDQGREVYAVPGSPLIQQTKGCHQMIQEGAKLVQEANDIFEDWETIGVNLYES